MASGQEEAKAHRMALSKSSASKGLRVSIGSCEGIEGNPLLMEARRQFQGLAKSKAVVYFLRLKSGVIYIGSSTDLEQRLDDHFAGQACRTTRLDPPLSVLRIEICQSFPEARQREAQLKGWSRAKKEALLRGDLQTLSALSESHEPRL